MANASRRRADRIAGALAPWVGIYAAGVALHALGIDARVVELALITIAVLIAIAILRPRARLVGGRVAIAGAAIGVAPLALASSPLMPLVPGALARIAAVALAVALESAARAILRARPVHGLVPVVASALIVASGAAIVTSSRHSPLARERLAVVPGAAFGVTDRPRVLPGATMEWRCERECEATLVREAGSRIAELPAWTSGIAFSRVTAEPVAVAAADLLGPEPELLRAAIVGDVLATLALLAAVALALRTMRLRALREVRVEHAGAISIDGAMLRTAPRLEPGPALIAPPRVQPLGYRDAGAPVPVIAGSREALLEALAERTLTLELLAIAAALTGLLPMLAAWAHADAGVGRW